jgi:hypothetical protein
MREITALHSRTHQERTLREDWPVVDGNWRRSGMEEIPLSCEGVAFSRMRGSGKAAQILEEGNGSRERERARDGMGEDGRARSVPGAHPI